jgi:HAD superfamily hydrolase (TIGR01549 family)
MDYLKKFLIKKKVIIFDLDGVLINSKNNMDISWSYTSKKNYINTPFSHYFKFIGLPFKEILNCLKIKKNLIKIKKDYDKASLKNLHKIKSYSKSLEVLDGLKNKGKKIALLTSKDTKRSKAVLKKLNFKFDYIECGKKNVKGKPDPYQLLQILKKLKVKRKNAVYVGDMHYDLLTAKNAKVDFIYATYGYGKIKFNKKKMRIKSISQLL